MLAHKTIVVCDGCGEKVVMDYASGKSLFGRSMLGDAPPPDWVEARGRHLCPSCATTYKELKERHEFDYQSG